MKEVKKEGDNVPEAGNFALARLHTGAAAMLRPAWIFEARIWK